MTTNVQGKLSSFQFTNPVVSEWLFSVNESFDRSKYGDMIQTSVSYQVDSSQQNANSIKIQLRMEIGEAGNISDPFYIKASIESLFKWDDNIEHEILDGLLKENAVTLLISYLRPMISQFTTYAGFSPFILPFLNIRNDNNIES